MVYYDAVLLTCEEPVCKFAIEYFKEKFRGKKVLVLSSNKRYEKFPKEYLQIKGNALLSFLSRWIVPKIVLDNFNIKLNFHPAPPEFPGIAPYSFALYERTTEYGVTCHEMIETVDSGKIIKVSRFPVSITDNVYTLRLKTLPYLLKLFYEILDLIVEGKSLPASNEKWRRRPYTKEDFLALCKIPINIPKEDLEKIIKATFYPGRLGAYIELHGYRFYYVDKSFFDL